MTTEFFLFIYLYWAGHLGPGHPASAGLADPKEDPSGSPLAGGGNNSPPAGEGPNRQIKKEGVFSGLLIAFLCQSCFFSPHTTSPQAIEHFAPQRD